MMHKRNRAGIDDHILHDNQSGENPILIHATCIALGDAGIIFCGDSGAGKSDIALRLIAEGALLVADDQVSLIRQDNSLIASPPFIIRGRIEARGIGIFSLPYRERITLSLYVRLRKEIQPEDRLPEKTTILLHGIHIPIIEICAFSASATAIIKLTAQGVDYSDSSSSLLSISTEKPA